MSHYLISCGGTGGHLSPGIALGEALVERGHQATLLISHKKVDARLIEKYAHLSFQRIPGAPFTLKPVGLARFVVKQVSAFFSGVNLVRKLRPAAVVGFGGFTTASVIVAGVLFNVPVVLHEANRVPGRAIRLLGRLARRVYLPPGIGLKGVRATALRPMGLPVRKEIVRESRDAACRSFGLDPRFRVLTILGGSQGATPLNKWAQEKAPALALDGVQVCCVSGMGKSEPDVREFRTSAGEPIKTVFIPFCDRMAALLSASDLVVSRAGAGTIAELIRCATPSILVPYPFAADNHQWANARYHEEQGGGLVVDQEQLVGLEVLVRRVMLDGARLQAFQTTLQRMDRAGALNDMLDDLGELSAPAATSAHTRPKHA